MSQITAIKEQQKNKNRYNIFLDSKFAFGVGENTLVLLGLRVGKNVDETQIIQYLQKAEEGKLFDKVLGFLGIRPRSEKEVRDYLRRKINQGKPPRFLDGELEAITDNERKFSLESQAQTILNKLKNLNYLNDREFAKWWIEQRIKGSKPRGERVIKLELRQKGVEPEIIDKALSEYLASKKEEGWNMEEEIERVAAKKYVKLSSYPYREQEPRLIKYLLGRGFNYNQLKPVVDRLTSKG